MSEATFACPSCGATYRRRALAAGKTVKCRRCSTTITVPRAAPAGSRMIPVLAAAGVVVAAVAVILVLRSGTSEAEPAPPPASAHSTPAGREQPRPRPHTAREIFDDHLAAAVTAAPADKAAHLLEAVAILQANDWADAGVTPAGLYAKVLDADPDNTEARRALGFIKYRGGYEKYAGKWLTKDEYAAATTEWQRLLAERKKKAAAATERARWEKDAFTRKCKRVRDHYDKDVATVAGLKLRYYFDTDVIPRPYFLMVEDASIPDPDATANTTIGPGLGALRRAFFAAYGPDVLPDWDEENRIVPVMIFKDAKSYEAYRAKHLDYGFPPTGIVAAFYVHRGPEGIDDICKGTLYVWQGAAENDFYHGLFHEATHQLMHNAAEMSQMPPTPWLEEGIAEFWGAYRGNQHSRFRFRQFLKGRFNTIQEASDAYFKWLRRGKKGDANFMTPKQFLGVGKLEFERARAALQGGAATPHAAQIVNYAYALGWAWIFWSHYGPHAAGQKKGKYIAPFARLLALELRHGFSLDELAKLYGITSDADWEAVTKDFYTFCYRDMRRWANDQPLPALPK